MPILAPDKLAEAIEEAGTTPTALALAIGRDKDYIRDYLVARKRSLKADDWTKIADKLGYAPLTMEEVQLQNDLQELPVVGTIRGGAWIETVIMGQEDRGSIPVGRDRRFPYATQYALAVSGDSMDLVAPHGSFVICVNFGESGLSLKQGQIVHVESVEIDKAETTLKEVAYENGQFILIPRSTNPIYKPIRVGLHDGVETRVRGVVLGVYNPLKP